MTEELGWYTEKSWFVDCDEVKRLRNYRDTLVNRMKSLEQKIEYRKTGQMLTDDNGAIGMSHICAKGKSEGHKFTCQEAVLTRFSVTMDIMELSILDIAQLVVNSLKIWKQSSHGRISLTTLSERI